MAGFTGRAAAAQSLHPGFVPDRWYQAVQGTLAAGGAGSANTIRMIPFVLPKPITIKALGARITTAGAAGNVQLAIYAHDAATGRPTGNALCSTASIGTGATGTISGAASATLQPGLYWMAINTDNATVVFQTVTAPFPLASFFIGSTNIANISSANAAASLALTVNQAFGTWPDLTGATFTENTTVNNAVVYLQAA